MVNQHPDNSSRGHPASAADGADDSAGSRHRTGRRRVAVMLGVLLVGLTAQLPITVHAGPVLAQAQAHSGNGRSSPVSSQPTSLPGAPIAEVNTPAKTPSLTSLYFEPNVGQGPSGSSFIARTSAGYSVDIGSLGYSVVISRAQPHVKRANVPPPPSQTHTLGFQWAGGSPSASIEGAGITSTVINYLRGSDPNQWRTQQPTYAEVVVRGLYPGINVVYRESVGGGIEFDYQLSAGVSSSPIDMAVTGATRIRVAGSGDLVLETPLGEVTEAAPIAYQAEPSGRRDVTAAYQLAGNHISLTLGAHDVTRPVTIDPAVVWSATLSGISYANAIAADSSGNTFITGEGASSGAFVTEVNAAGTSVVFTTYLAGNSSDQGTGIAVDGTDNSYVVGSTSSSSFPLHNAIQTTPGPAFVVKLDPTGAIVYSTYFGSGSTTPNGVAVDSSGAAYFTGHTGSGGIPIANAFQATYGGGSYDGFVTKVNSAGSAWTYSTYLGGSGSDRGQGIAVDSTGEAYVVGMTTSSNFPLQSAIQSTNYGAPSSSDSAFVTKLASSGSTLVYSSFLGGHGDDYAMGVAVDSSGSAYVTGTANSSDFPVVSPHYQSGNAGATFVTKVNAAGSAWTYSTYVGGSGIGGYAATGYAIAINGAGEAYVSVYTTMPDFPTTFGFGGAQRSGDLLYRLGAQGDKLIESTWLNSLGAVNNNTDAVATDGAGNIYALAPRLAKLITGPPGGALTTGESLSVDNPSQGCPHCLRFDPVDPATGNFTETQSDISIPGRSIPLQFDRTYNSAVAASNGLLGYGWTFSFNTSLSCSGTTATITQENGSTVSFATTGSCSSGTWTPSAPRTVAGLTHNPDGTWTFLRRGQLTFTFNSAGQLTTETDLNGYATTLAYSSGQLSSVTDPAGRALTIAISGGHITGVTDTSVTPNRSVGFQYNDGAGNLTDVIDVNGGHWQFTYVTHLLTALKDPQCYATSGCPGVQNHYNGVGQVDWQKDQLNRQSTLSYSGATTTVTNPAGHSDLYVYAYGVPVSVTRGYGTVQASTTQYRYDGNVMEQNAIVDGNGNTTVQTFDASGNVLTRTDALARETISTYNAFNEPLTVQDGKGTVTTATYDSRGNLTSTSTPLVGSVPAASQVTSYNHADSSHPGDVTSMVDPDTKTWSYGYDSYGHRVETKDPLGNVTAFVFNADGWLTASYTPKAGCTWAALPPAGCSVNYQTTYSYVVPGLGTTDEFGDVQTVTDPVSHVTTHGYDADRNVTTLKDGSGNLTTYVFDAANEQTQVKRADTPQTTVTTDYNLDGTVLDQKDGKGNAIQTYGYNSLAQVTSVKDALGNETDFTYDGVGNQLTKQDPGGNCSTASKCTTSTYDVANELKSVTYSDGVTPNVTGILYDGDGQRTAWSDGSGAWTQVFDSLHRLTSVTEGASGTVAYAYNLRNLPTTITYPGGVHAVTETYDDAGRWTKVQDWNGNVTTIGYDANSNLTSYTLPTATTVIDTMTFNKADQLTSITDNAGATAFYAASYTYNPASQLITDTSAPTAQAKFHYTALNQLCYAGSANSTSCPNAPTGSEPFAYDAADNLVKLNTTTQQFNAADQLCWTVSGSSSNACTAPPAGATGYTYDTNGNRTAQTPSAGAATCDSYDQANRLVKVTTGTGASCTSPSTLGTYSYNGSGLRMAKTVAGVSTTEAWDLSGGLPLLLEDKTSSATVDYVFGPGGVPLEQIGTATLWYHHDQLGSTRAITNASGATQATYQYDPYGNLITSTGSVANPFMYSGQYKDNESGLYYLRARYYDPGTGQFLSRDPAVAMTRAPYAYVAGNPLNGSDPSGLLDPNLMTSDQRQQLFNTCSGKVDPGLCLMVGFCANEFQCAEAGMASDIEMLQYMGQNTCIANRGVAEAANDVRVATEEVNYYQGNDNWNHRFQSANNYASEDLTGWGNTLSDIAGCTGGSAYGAAKSGGEGPAAGVGCVLGGVTGILSVGVGWIKGLFENDYGKEAG